MDIASKNFLKYISINSLSTLPKTWGVYFFLDKENYPLYIGMSNNLRNRLRSHFIEKTLKKARLKMQTTQIGYIETSGFLSTSLLESKLIKKYKPQFNKMLRKEKYLAVLEFDISEDGYKIVKATHEKKLKLTDTVSGLGIFRSKRKAEDILQKIQAEYFLCPKLLGLESGSGACFSYHLKKCSGACTQAIGADEYNQLFNNAISDFVVPEWKTNLEIEEKNKELVDNFTIQNWTITKHISNHLKTNLANTQNFNYDTYRIIKTYLYSKNTI